MLNAVPVGGARCLGELAVTRGVMQARPTAASPIAGGVRA